MVIQICNHSYNTCEIDQIQATTMEENRNGEYDDNKTIFLKIWRWNVASLWKSTDLVQKRPLRCDIAFENKKQD